MKSRMLQIFLIIIILSIISIIFIPKSIKLLNKDNLKYYKTKENIIISKAKKYIEYNNLKSTYISVTDLINKKYLTNIIDPYGNTCDGFIMIDNNEYKVCLICNKYHTNKDYCTKENSILSYKEGES